MIKVTICIINYNYGRFLKHAIDSALGQKGHRFVVDVLVIDDGSSDVSDIVAQEYSNNTSVKVSKTVNQGFGPSLTRAIKEATGEYVYLLDADDYFLPSKIESTLPFLMEKQYEMVVDDVFALYSSTEYEPFEKQQPGGSTSTIGLSRKTALKLLPVENELFFHVLTQLGKAIYIGSAHTVYRYHGTSMTNRNEAGKWNTYLSTMTNNLVNHIPTIYKNDAGLFKGISQMKFISNHYRARASYNQLEAKLELQDRIGALSTFFKYLFYTICSNTFSIFTIKMLIKTVIMRPSFNRKNDKV